LIFKHAISTVVSTRSVLHGDHRPSTGVGHPPASATGPGGLSARPDTALAEG
jgi:host factor-I protein